MIKDRNSSGMALERLSTGNAALDAILGGGLPARSVTVITGAPGTGKTVVSLQLLFNLARQGKKCLYLATLSEPAMKMIRYMQLFSFFDLELLDERVIVADASTAIRARRADLAVAEIMTRVEQEQPDLVAIDSFKAIRDLLGEPAVGRALVYDLAVHLPTWGATTLLVGEYADQEIGTQAEFAIADGIIRLSNQAQELTTVRQLEVLKLRGASYTSGLHFFEIGPEGASFYPRVRAPVEPPTRSGQVDFTDRVRTGVEGLDALLHGGLPRGTATVVEGATGTGKTLLGLHFLLNGVHHGERGLFLSLEESSEQLRGVAANFGWDLAAMEDDGRLALASTSPVELSTDRFLNQAREQVERLGARRVFLDSLTSLALGVVSERRFKELVFALTRHVRLAGASLMMSLDAPELLGSPHLASPGASFIADNLIRLRYVQVEGRLERAISVLKARGIPHETTLSRLDITDAGATLGGVFVDLPSMPTSVPAPRRRSGDGR